MKHFFSVAVFTLAVSLFYTGVAQVLPQLENRPPRILNWGEDLSADELVSAGAEIFEGNCGQCHMIGQPGGRGPDLAGIGGRALGRAAEIGGMDDAEYLLEALCDPGAYIVDGYANIMPPQGRALSVPQMVATVAFMQGQGADVTVSIADLAAMQSTLDKAGCDTGGGAAAAPVEVVELGPPEELFTKFGCSGCHAVDKPDAGLGPSLMGLGERSDKWAIYEALVDPDAVVAAPYAKGLMKATLDGNGFYQQMTPKDYQAMVDWLADL